MTNFDIESTETLICPYCGTEQEDAREQEDWSTPENWTCSDCTRDFVYTTETFVKFTSEDLGEYLEEKLSQENDWLLTLAKELTRLELGLFHGIKLEEIKKQKERVEKCKQRISDLEKRFDNYCKQKFEPVELGLSNCCNYQLQENTDICSKCGEHCETTLK